MGTVSADSATRGCRKHGVYEPSCFGCKISTISIGSARGQEYRRADAEFSADQDAYKRLRRDGLQPNSPKGAAEVERHQLEQVEIDYKQRLKPAHKEQLKEIQSQVELNAWTGGGVNG